MPLKLPDNVPKHTPSSPLPFPPERDPPVPERLDDLFPNPHLRTDQQFLPKGL